MATLFVPPRAGAGDPVLLWLRVAWPLIRSVLVYRCTPAGSVLPCWFDRCRRRSRTRSPQWRARQATSAALAAFASARPVQRPVHPQAPTHSKVPGSLKARIINTATTLTATKTTGTISSSGYMACANTDGLQLHFGRNGAECHVGCSGLTTGCWRWPGYQCTTVGSGCVATSWPMVSSMAGMVRRLLKVSRA